MMHTYAAGMRLALLVLALSLSAGCASTRTPAPGDPLESGNRGVYKFNDALDRGVLRPTAKGYVKVTPNWFRTGVGNFFTNLEYPVTIVNQLLQGKVKAAGQDTARFLINSTLGWGGVFDVASGTKLPHHDEDLGQTLGYWGIPPGPYLMVPLIGPSSVRDLPSSVADSIFSPFAWYAYGNERWVALGLDIVDTRAQLLPLDASLERVYDKYGFVRDAYQQRRLYLVHDGNPPEEALDEGFDDEPDDEPEDAPEDAPEDPDPAADKQE